MHDFFKGLIADIVKLKEEGWTINITDLQEKTGFVLMLIPPERPSFKPLFSALNDLPHMELSTDERRDALMQAAAFHLDVIRERQKQRHLALRAIKPRRRTYQKHKNVTLSAYYRRQTNIQPRPRRTYLRR